MLCNYGCRQGVTLPGRAVDGDGLPDKAIPSGNRAVVIGVDDDGGIILGIGDRGVALSLAKLEDVVERLKKMGAK